MANTPKSDRSDGIWWLIIIGGFLIGAWPLSVVLIILKSANKLPNLARFFSRGQKQQPPPPVQTPPQTAQTAPPAPQKPTPNRPGRLAKALTVIGIILVVIGVATFLGSEVMWDIRNGLWEFVLDDIFDYAEESMRALCWTAGGIVSLALGRRQRKKRARYDQYAQLIGDNDFLPIDSIADATGRNYNQIVADLQDMIERGYLPGAWIDLKHRRLMLTEMQIDETPAAPRPDPAPAEPAVSESEKILRQIRADNDLIADPDISRKIDRIEALTAKIFQCLEERPEKREQLTSFLNYYLPQTLKILEMYARLEHQGIEGENIAAAKRRISGMLDKLADGYERQLDRLFSDEVLDITTDIAVMEQMLAKDGLGEDILRPEPERPKPERPKPERPAPEKEELRL